MRETPSRIFCDHLRETSTSAHLISCCLTDGRSVSFLRQKERAQKARKLGLLELSTSLRTVISGSAKREEDFFDAEAGGRPAIVLQTHPVPPAALPG